MCVYFKLKVNAFVSFSEKCFWNERQNGAFSDFFSDLWLILSWGMGLTWGSRLVAPLRILKVIMNVCLWISGLIWMYLAARKWRLVESLVRKKCKDMVSFICLMGGCIKRETICLSVKSWLKVFFSFSFVLYPSRKLCRSWNLSILLLVSIE